MKKTNKRWLAVILSLILLICMTACRKADASPPATTAPMTTAPSDTVPETTGGTGGAEVTAPTQSGNEADKNGEAVTVPATDPSAPVETTVPVTVPADGNGADAPVATTKPVEKPQGNTVAHTHSYTDTVVAATCTAGGYTRHTCSCGHSYDDAYTSALGHTYVSSVVAPTCKEGGYTLHTCSGCGANYTDSATEKLTEHSWGEWTLIREASVNAPGLERRYCATCDNFENKSIPKLDPYADPEYLAAFLKEAAAYTVQYINQFRVEQGGTAAEVLPGLTVIAEERADQLLVDYRHDDAKLRALCNKYQYGRYVDFAEAGMPEWVSDNYYTFGGAEAIGKANDKNPEAHTFGKEMAESVRDSAGHWRYVGDSKNCYIAVAYEYDANASDGFPWKCCILLTDTNYG